MLLRRQLDPELHGCAGFTSVYRLVAMVMVMGFFGLASHLGTQAWYNGRILPGVNVAGRDLGGLSLAQARVVLRQDSDNYRLHLKVAGEKYVLPAAGLGVTFDPDATAAAAYESGRDKWLPPLYHDRLEMVYKVDRSVLNSFAASVADRVGTSPVDAGVVVTAGAVSTVPDKSGWSIDKVGLERLVEADVRTRGGGDLTLNPREQLADISVKALEPTVAEANRLMAVPVVLTYGSQTFTPNASEIGQWLSFAKQADGAGYKLTAEIDNSKLKNFVQNLANQLDVAPVNKTVTIENGVSKTTKEGVDGTAIDSDPLSGAIADALSKQVPLEYAITTHPVAFKTISTNLVSLDYGRYIEVNLSKQHLWVWEDHAVIYETPITSGATGAGLGTVTGLFSIYYKTTNTHLVGYQYGYNYDVPVKYWMPFYSGYGMHDATWRNGNFGGQDYYYGGSHGCVNLPDTAAEFIYNWASVGTPVWVHK